MGLKTNQTRQSGFTIVELLIVVVVIAILAAITIVSYNGITTQANDAAAKSAASTAATKIESYQAKVGNYPATFGALNNSAEPYHLTTGILAEGSDFDAEGPIPEAQRKNTVIVIKCGSGSPASQASITAPSGVKIYYWDFYGAALTATPTQLGTTTGTGITCPDDLNS